MTLRRALELSLDVARLPYSMAIKVRGMELEVIEEIMKDKSLPSIYDKYYRFEHELEMINPETKKVA